jgi:methylenetetrahydrofolate reductase (NADPH)
MNTNQKELNIKNLLNRYSIETTPNVYAKYGNFSELVPFENSIYVTYLPDEDSKRVIYTSKKLTEEGYDVIPHLPARTIENHSTLERYIGALSENAGCNKILVVGGGGKQKGDISSSIDVLKTELLSKYKFKEVGLAGHPEGNPDISESDMDKAIVEKNTFAKNADFKMYLATQFFFEVSSLMAWEKKLNLLNNNLEIHAGLPGPATLKTLVGYATSCGIKNSIRFLSKQAMNITKLATTRTPDKLIADLADYKQENPDSKLTKLHFYAFGGIKKTSEWLQNIKDHKLEINNKNEFKPIVK